MSCTPGPLKNVLNTFCLPLWGNEFVGYCFGCCMGKLRGWGCAVGLWFHSLRERRKVGDYLAPCCCTWLCLDQPGQGASCCQTGNQYSALLRSQLCFSTCGRQGTNANQFFLSYRLWSLLECLKDILAVKMNPHSTTPLDHCKDVLVVLLDFMACFWIRIHQSYQFS